MRRGGVAALLAALVVFVGGTVLGLGLLTSDAEVTSSGPTCEPRSVQAGEKLTPNLVTVSVYNASRTAGLANRFSVQFQRRNFLPGRVANNPTEWTTDDALVVAQDQKDPRVELVGAQLGGKVKFQQGTVPGSEGVSVLVGRNYAGKSLKKKAPKSVVSDRRIDACLPIAPEL